ncbi:CLUMA_CG006428, isoform A [Clunio marinus]|uniref:CLUMA_CG006428, isoform A n=1 Tax=Clunio marinus TaxID=568069 RepID=A0A1J1HXV7_9DIPT|nr:CLUMA_CG006428, isoform A [Clunio marinus]
MEIEYYSLRIFVNHMQYFNITHPSAIFLLRIYDDDQHEKTFGVCCARQSYKRDVCKEKQHTINSLKVDLGRLLAVVEGIVLEGNVV